MASNSVYQPCEHFYKYNRLEGRPRETELDDSLAAKIHDPLWMLARQYQFGEFQGEDAGSAIFAKLAMNKVNLSGQRNHNQPFLPVDNNVPLETTVEKLSPVFDNKMALRMGNKFLQLFSEAGKSLAKWPADGYKQELIMRFPFKVPSPDITSTPGLLAAQVREKTLRESALFLKAIAGKGVNGASLWKYLSGKPAIALGLVRNISNAAGIIEEDHKTALVQAATLWIEWVYRIWNIPFDNNTAWTREKMEYDFDVAIDEDNNMATVLHADEYHQGHLDWFAFDVGETKRPMEPGEPQSGIKRSREVKSLIPTQASFKGMPNARWWELEDSSVDPGNLKATDTDVAAVLIAQYALLYSNDWLMIPCDVPVGSMVEIEGIVVTDTFGNKTFVEAAHKENDNNWKEWSMYSLASKAEGFDAPGIEQRIFIPPAAVKVIEAEPVEQIRFIRDEMSNMVWGIERIVPDGMGSGIDGYETAAGMEAQYRQLVEKKKPADPDEIEIDSASPGENIHLARHTGPPQLKYTLGNTVTENWIPFIPVHVQGSNRAIQLQRASMPRINEVAPPHQVRPRTPLLRDGIAENDSQGTPYYIYEEEVPRAGAVITGAFQRTRWYQGRIVTWYGRKKTTGRGEGSSGLKFDFISDNF